MGEVNQLAIGGLIELVDCDGITDLNGFENVTSWSSLRLAGLDNLVSLAGLQTPPRVQEIDINGAPLLADVSALATLEQVGALNIAGSAIENLDLRLLYEAESIDVWNNRALIDLDGLRELEIVGNLIINDNDALVRAGLPSLGRFDSISIVGNAELQAVPHYQVNSGESIPSAGNFINPFGSGQVLFEVGDNPQVKSIVMPTNFSNVAQVAIYRNPSLTSLDMGNLLRSDNLWIEDNAVLDTLAAPSLARVDELSVKNNPALSVAPFANVQTFTRDVTGNLDELTP
jgi:hypothetical protein